jgi:hypothetical protein
MEDIEGRGAPFLHIPKKGVQVGCIIFAKEKKRGYRYQYERSAIQKRSGKK